MKGWVHSCTGCILHSPGDVMTMVVSVSGSSRMASVMWCLCALGCLRMSPCATQSKSQITQTRCLMQATQNMEVPEKQQSWSSAQTPSIQWWMHSHTIKPNTKEPGNIIHLFRRGRTAQQLREWRSRARLIGFKSYFTTYQLCDPGQALSSLWASVSSIIWG